MTVDLNEEIARLKQENDELRECVAIPDKAEQFVDRILDRCIEAQTKLCEIERYWNAFAETAVDDDSNVEQLALFLCLARAFGKEKGSSNED